jgi:transcriptional regulator with XRE-family HTH domain
VAEAKQSNDMFRKRLRAARDLRGLTQAQLAAKVGMPASSITVFEGGSRKPSIDNLRRLADGLDVSADYLLGRVADPAPEEASDPLFREATGLSAKDRVLAGEFLRFLIDRAKSSRD